MQTHQGVSTFPPLKELREVVYVGKLYMKLFIALPICPKTYICEELWDTVEELSISAPLMSFSNSHFVSIWKFLCRKVFVISLEIQFPWFLFPYEDDAYFFQYWSFC